MDVDTFVRDDSVSMRQMVQLYDELTRRFTAIPGVTQVGGANFFPLAGGSYGDGVFIIMSRMDEKLDFAQLPQLIKDRSRSGQAEFRVAPHTAHQRTSVRRPRRAERAAGRGHQCVARQEAVA